MSILQLSLSIPISSQSLSSSRFFSGETPLSLLPKLSHLSLSTTTPTLPSIRMGGGPRTYPGGVTKWQWKRMQSKRFKQLLKARLARERQIYEMRKRAELQAAVTELERPWEVVKKPPALFSATADEQVKVLADRFQKAGGFDLWSEKDGPQLFESVDDGVVGSKRFFPKGVVHSIKPYGRIGDGSKSSGVDELGEIRVQSNGLSKESGNGTGNGVKGRFRKQRNRRNELGSNGIGSSLNRVDELGENGGEIRVRRNGLSDESGSGNGNGNGYKGKFGKQRNMINELGSNGVVSNGDEKNGRVSNGGVSRRSSSSQTRRFKGSNSEVYDMNLQQDGSYEFRKEN